MFPSRPRNVKKPKASNQAIKFLPLILPSVLFAFVGLFFREPLQKQVQQLLGNRTSNILVEELPGDCEIWIDNQRARFERPNAHSAAAIAAEPGTYKLSLRRDGKILREQNLTVEAGRDVRVTVNALWLNSLSDKQPADNKPNPNGTTADTATRKDKEDSSSTFGESQYQPPPSPSIIAAAIASTEIAIKSRNANQALQELATLFDNVGNSRLQDYQSESAQAKHLKRLAKLLQEFNDRLTASVTKRQLDERLHFGNQTHIIVDVDQSKLSLRSNDNITQFETSDLPVNVEQCILDLQLEHDSQQSSLVKAVGIATNKNASAFDKLTLNLLLKFALDDQVVDESFCEFVKAFAGDATDAESESEASTHTLQRSLAGAQGPIQALYLLPPNVPFPKQTSLLASCSGTGRGSSTGAPFWNIETGVIGSRPPIEGPIWAFETSSNGRVLATLGSQSEPHLRVYGLPVVAPIYQLKEIDAALCDITLSSDGRFLAGCNLDEVFLRWNLQGKSVASTTVSRLPVGRDNIDAITIRPTMDVVAVASKEGDIRMWYTSDGREKWKSTGNATPIRALKFTRRSDRLLAIRQDGTFELRNFDTPDVTQSFKPHSSKLTTIGFSTKGRYLTTADCYNNIRVWDTDDMTLHSDFTVYHPSHVVSVTADSIGETVAVAFEDSSIELWRKR